VDNTVLKPRCANRCDSGFHLQNVVLATPEISVPIYMCKRCGYWVLSSQTRFINSCYNVGNICKEHKDYEVALDYYLKEGLSHMF
jgi:hypothetical protein